jgi:CubicO group peptidase (beta-lactamase class C family)
MQIPAALAATLLAVAACRTAAPRVDSEDTRILRIEDNLLPAVVIEGRAAGRPIAERMERLRVARVSVAVLDEGRLVWARAHGGAGVETLFQAGDLSQPVAAVVALRLVAAGKLALDEDVAGKLRGWRPPDGQALTLRQLLAHTGGLSVHGFPGYPAGAPLPTLPQILDGLPPATSGAVRVTHPQGEYRRSAGGYAIAQLLVEEVAGKPFAEVARAELFEPLGMTSSTFAQPLPAALAARAAAAGLVYPELAAAGLWTTPSELARLLAEIGRARAGQSRLLPRELATAATSAGPGNVGLGFFVDGAGPTLRIRHAGASRGYRASFVYYLESGKGAVVMASGDGGDLLAAEIFRAVAVEYAWSGFPGPVVKKVAAADPSGYPAYVGRYRVAPGVLVTVALDGDRLTLAAPGGDAAELHPAGDDHFFLLATDARVRFVRDGDTVTALEADIEGRHIVAPREP